MITLSEAKQWLRLEESDTTEDTLLQRLIDTATEYIRNSVPSGMTLEGNSIAKLIASVLIADWYENRGSIGQVRGEVLPTVQVLLAQLRNAYPAIETASLPDAAVGAYYSASLQVLGGVPPYTWTVLSGTLPDGLALDAKTGIISGTPATSGDYSFVVGVTDKSDPARTASRALSITVVTST